MNERQLLVMLIYTASGRLGALRTAPALRLFVAEIGPSASGRNIEIPAIRLAFAGTTEPGHIKPPGS